MVVLLAVLFSLECAVAADKPPIPVKKDAEIRQIKPPKPVKIKLHRTAKGEYSWDITGDQVDEVVRADKKLRTLLKVE
jgi:hypothetical protein